MDLIPIEIFQNKPKCQTTKMKKVSDLPSSMSTLRRDSSERAASAVGCAITMIPYPSLRAPPLAKITFHPKTSEQKDIDSPRAGEGSFQAWTTFIHKIHRPILVCLHEITQCSARNPWTTICMALYFSMALLTAGLFTGFAIDDNKSIWTPQYSATLDHEQWINYRSGFQAEPRFVTLFFHADGKDVLGRDQVEDVFKALDVITRQPDWETVCTRDEDGECRIHGITEFWNQSYPIFSQEVESDSEAILAMSSLNFPRGNPVDENALFGFPERSETGLLLKTKSYTLHFRTQRQSKRTLQFELDVVGAILEMSDKWTEQGKNLRVEIDTERSFDDEFDRGIRKDLPLIPCVFVIMAVFTCCFFFKRDRVRSRMLLGISAVVSVVLSLMSGYGLMFICGVKFTSMTPILPFVIFGIGLDDAYIIAFAYDRRDSQKDVLERIRNTVDDIGISITLTTMTSMAAFALGSISSIPVVYWLCYYAVSTIGFVLVYQITFFVACIALDEQRIEARRSDCIPCARVQEADKEDGDHSRACTSEACTSEVDSFGPFAPYAVTSEPSTSDAVTSEACTPEACTPDAGTSEPFASAAGPCFLTNDCEAAFSHKEGSSLKPAEDFMTWYANLLLNPCVKFLVICSFSVLLVFAALSATQLRQEFDLVDIIPDDSYVADFFNAVELYTARKATKPALYFRDVDQSKPEVQDQMERYVNEVVAMEGVLFQPEYFWLRSFKQFLNETDHIANKTFNEQLHVFLSDPVNKNLYKKDIVLDEEGGIVASRCFVYLDDVDLDDVQEQIDALRIAREVGSSQAINRDVSEEDARFFTSDPIFNIWAFYTAVVEELILTTISGVAAVTFVSMILVPHWTAAISVLPLICMLYVDLLGVLQWAGVTVNVVSYIALVMSIGLMVDFVMHVLLRYHEISGTPEDRTVEMLQTMGRSVLIGATSTLLGTMSLVFSASAIFTTVFISFVGLVVLGAAHGLILLPVVLSTIGARKKDETDGPKRSKIMEFVQYFYMFF